MTPGLNFARASCAAERSEGSASASARSSRHAASREIGFAPSLANSAAADSASGEKVAIRRYFEIRFIEIQRKQRSYRQIILAKIITDTVNPCPYVADCTICGSVSIAGRGALRAAVSAHGDSGGTT